MFDELKKLAKQVSIYGVGAFIPPLISFLMLPVYTRYLTTEDYGVLALALMVSLIFNALAGCGVASGILRIYYCYTDKKEQDSVIITSLLFSTVFSVAIAAILCLFGAPVSAVIFHFVPQQEYLFQLIVLSGVFSIFSYNLFSVLRSEEKPKVYAGMTIVNTLITLSLNIFFVVILRRGVIGIQEAWLLSNVVVSLVLIPAALGKRKGSFSYEKLKEVLNFGIPLVPLLLVDIVLSLSDRYFLEYFDTLKEVGIYSLGYRIAAVISIIVIKPFTTAWSPYMYSVSSRPNAKEIYRNVLVYYAFICAWAGIGLSMFAKEVIMLTATKAFYEGYKVVPGIVFGYIVYGMLSILIAGVQITKNTKKIRKVFFIGVIVNIICDYILIPPYSMIGAAWSTVIAYVFMNISYFVISQKYYRIDHDYVRMVKIACCSFLLYYLSTLPVSENIIFSILWKLGLFAIYPLVLYIMRFYSKYELDKFRSFLSKKSESVNIAAE